jgi:hypothetical protein
MPPDWTTLACDLELGLDEGVQTAILVTLHIDAVNGKPRPARLLRLQTTAHEATSMG